MDERVFDSLARAVGASASRRGALVRLGAAGLAALAGGLAGRDETGARRRRPPREKPRRPGKWCSTGAGCTSGVCRDGRCQAPTCADGVKNGAETGPDCGGPCAPCVDGLACEENADCAGGMCCNGGCARCKPGSVCDLRGAPGTCCDPDPVCVTCRGQRGRVTDRCGQTIRCQGDGRRACPRPVGEDGGPRNVCCPDDSCSCAGACCPSKDDCFIETRDDGGVQVPFREFCCTGEGSRVCGDDCCDGPCNDEGTGCLNATGRLGTYRRGTVG